MQLDIPTYLKIWRHMWMLHQLISEQLLIVSLWLSTRLSSKTQGLNFFYQLFGPGFGFDSGFGLGFSNLGSKTRVFNFQFLTQPDISFSRFPNFKPQKGHFLVYFNKPNKWWYFVTKIVLTYCEKKLFYWSRKTFEIRGWSREFAKFTRTIYSNRERSE